MKKLSKKQFTSFVRKVPKAEIHIHIEAVITLKSVKKLYAKRFGKEMSPEEEKSLFAYNDLKGFIDSFLKIQDMFIDVSDFDFVFEDFGKYLVNNGIKYCEAFFAPSAFVKKGFDYKAMVENFSKNIEKIKKEKGITIKLLTDVSRTFGLENAQANYAMFKECPNENIIGIGLGGNEAKGPCNLFGPVFEKARADGFHAVAHAGEDVGPESVWDAVKILGAERIGHGISSIQDESLMDYLREKQIPIECCPTSNIFTKKYVHKMEDHPIRAFFDKGLLVTVNTDDPVFFKTTLIDELYAVYTKLNFTEDEIKALIINSFKASFLSESEKKAFIDSVEESWKAISDIPSKA